MFSAALRNFWNACLMKYLCRRCFWSNPAGNNLFKVNSRNTRTRCEICSKLKIKTPEWRQWRRSGFFIVNFEHMSHLVVVFLLLTLSRQMPARKSLLRVMILIIRNSCSYYSTKALSKTFNYWIENMQGVFRTNEKFGYSLSRCKLLKWTAC